MPQKNCWWFLMKGLTIGEEKPEKDHHSSCLKCAISQTSTLGFESSIFGLRSGAFNTLLHYWPLSHWVQKGNFKSKKRVLFIHYKLFLNFGQLTRFVDPLYLIFRYIKYSVASKRHHPLLRKSIFVNIYFDTLADDPGFIKQKLRQ